MGCGRKCWKSGFPLTVTWAETESSAIHKFRTIYADPQRSSAHTLVLSVTSLIKSIKSGACCLLTRGSLRGHVSTALRSHTPSRPTKTGWLKFWSHLKWRNSIKDPNSDVTVAVTIKLTCRPVIWTQSLQHSVRSFPLPAASRLCAAFQYGQITTQEMPTPEDSSPPDMTQPEFSCDPSVRP